MTCRWDRAAQAHLTREHLPECIDTTCRGCRPCTHEDGNPVRHCRTRLRCTSHLDWTEATCPECLAKVRANLSTLLDCLALMPDEAIEQGINSEPANLAGPHADYVTSSWRLINADRNGEPVEDLDMRDPYTCLTLHERTIREELGHDAQTLVSPTIAASAGYLSWVLTDLARDEDRTPLLMALMGATASLRVHVESALRDGRSPERGAPCPACVEDGKPPRRLHRIYGHWCLAVGCCKTHYLDSSGDVWRCPDDPTHEWTHAAYSNYLVQRKSA